MIVVFDAQCLLCHAGVRFLLRHDRRAVLRFASAQGATGRRLLADHGLGADSLDTLLVIDGAKAWQRSAALLRLLHVLGWPWRLGRVLWLLPSPVRDAAYGWVARHRLRMFGRADRCLVPSADDASRFLD